jgi:hypothetical protein
MTIRVAIFGGSGYGGSELLRILMFHPNVEIAFVTAHEHAGKRVAEVHKNLLGLTNLEFQRAPEDMSSANDIDLAFFALPHGQAMDLIPKLPDHVKAIDLSGDFRIDDAAIFEQHYKLCGRSSTPVRIRIDGDKPRRYQVSEVHRQSGMLRDCDATCARPDGEERIAERKDHCRRQDGLERIGDKAGIEYPSPTEVEFFLRVQAVHSSTRTGDRAASRQGGGIRQRVYFHDAQSSSLAGHIRIVLHGDKGQPD